MGDPLRAVAADYALTAMGCVVREFPHLPMVHATEPGPYRPHRVQHPVFYGALDWHSSVLMHWVLVRLLRECAADVPEVEIRRLLDAQLTPEHLATEAAFFSSGFGRSRERPYGWGWLLTLTHELRTWDDADAQRWADALTPPAEVLVTNLVDWLPGLQYPVRSGLHPNTAFGLLRAYDHAVWLAERGDARLCEAIHDAVRRWYLGDVDYPAHYEPSGSDFLSPALAEAELVSRVLPGAAFIDWFAAFLPGADRAEPRALFDPPAIGDTTDGQAAHLAGLNLSRAWSMVEIAGRLFELDARREALLTSADRHAEAGLAHVVGGDYMVEHWLAGYAVGYLTA